MKFLGRSWRNLAKNLFYTGKFGLPEMLIQQPAEFLTAVTHKSLTSWSSLMDHQKAERVVIQNSIWYFWSFSQSEARN
jgi:hypothetical protein